MTTMQRAALLAVLVTLAACGSEQPEQSATTETPVSNDTVPAAGEAGASHLGVGTVDAVSASEVTISHEEIKSAGWPAMKMGFSVSDPALLDGIKPGDPVTFTFSKTGSTSTLTEIAKK